MLQRSILSPSLRLGSPRKSFWTTDVPELARDQLVMRRTSDVLRRVVWGVQTPLPEIPKVSVESSIA